MSNNHLDKTNENIDGFNLSKEELMNCFGSQICSQSSNSNYEYQDDNIRSDIQKKSSSNQIQAQSLNKELNENSNNYINKDDIIKNICHTFIDVFFSQKEELKGIKDEIKKLQNLMINNNNNNNNNKKSLPKKVKINNQK